MRWWSNQLLLRSHLLGRNKHPGSKLSLSSSPELLSLGRCWRLIRLR